MDSSLRKVPDKPHNYANVFVASILMSFENHTSRLKSVVCSTLELFLSDTTQRTRNVLATRRGRYRECFLFPIHFSITEGRMFLITIFLSAELRSSWPASLIESSDCYHRCSSVPSGQADRNSGDKNRLNFTSHTCSGFLIDFLFLLRFLLESSMGVFSTLMIGTLSNARCRCSWMWGLQKSCSITYTTWEEHS